MMDTKKKSNIKNELIEFLNNHRFKPDIDEKHTHSSWGTVIQGKFYIDSNEIKNFTKLYIKAIESNITDLSILEIQKEYSMIIVDIDLKVPIDDISNITYYNTNNRLYDDTMIMYIIEKYISVLNKYFILDESTLHELSSICVFEKEEMQQQNDIYKDGFHIMFPYVCTNTNCRHLIRNDVVKLCSEDNIFDNYLESIDKIIDKSIVSSNGWFLYGSKKPIGLPYKLTKSYDIQSLKVLPCNTTTSGLIKYLSIHYDHERYSKKNKIKLKDMYTEESINNIIFSNGINTKNLVTDLKEITQDKEILIQKACAFVNMLSDTRADSYEDWRNVGLALHNTDDSLLYIWIEFSKKCEYKFKRGNDHQGDCYKFWTQFKNPDAGNLLTIRSLAYWAKQDNPLEYEIYMYKEFKNTLKNNMGNNTWKIATTFHNKYADVFVCSCIKNNIWWKFNGTRWSKINDACDLKILLSKEFADEYHKEAADLNNKMTTIKDEDERLLLHEKIKTLNNIAERLMNITFKKKIIEEASALFLDTEFESKLDSNINLIGFEEGVYDLELNKFREGKPDDYISLSTKNNYMKYTEKMPYLKNIIRFFNQVLPNQNVRNYLLKVLSTCLSGETKEEKLYILTGSGSNGKSLTMDLMAAALGDYYMSCPITILTRKRGTSNETSPEKVRMKGKRCGVFQETDDGDKINVGIMKEFTGGDKILVRDLYKGAADMIQFKPQIKLILTCNQLPNVPSNDDGTWRRLRVIEFNSKFTSTPDPSKDNEFLIDTNLKQSINAWAPTFISYLLHIYIEYKKMPYLEDPIEVQASTNQYKKDNDRFIEYITSKIITTNDENDIIDADKLYNDFKVWFKIQESHATIPKRNEFDKNMVKYIGKIIDGNYIKVMFKYRLNEDTDIID